jgi:hypothetical protein
VCVCVCVPLHHHPLPSAGVFFFKRAQCIAAFDAGPRPPLPERKDIGSMTAGERMKADAHFDEVLRLHEEEVASWQGVVDRYHRVGAELETSFGPHAFPRLMAAFLATPGDVDCAQYGAQGLCRLATSTSTKKWVVRRGWCLWLCIKSLHTFRVFAICDVCACATLPASPAIVFSLVCGAVRCGAG